MDLILFNKNNQSLDLLNNRNRFILYKAEALHGVETDIATSESPYMDGVQVDSVKALPRGIELGFKLVGDIKESIDFITSYIKSKQTVTLREVENGREITVKGIATIPPYTRMLAACELTLTIYCGQPYWEDLNYIVGSIDEKIELLYFPMEGQFFTAAGRPFGVIDTSTEKTFTNDGDTSIGMLFKMTCLGTITKPIIRCSTGNQNGWYMKLNLVLQENDLLEINTVKGNKYITINGSHLYNNVPILSYLSFNGNDWLQLEQGANTFHVTTDNENENGYFEFSIIYKRRFE